MNKTHISVFRHQYLCAVQVATLALEERLRLGSYLVALFVSSAWKEQSLARRVCVP